MSNAHPDEMTFVLLGRDPVAPKVIRIWAQERVRLGKNAEDDPQITEALECARTMEVEGRKWVGLAKAASASKAGLNTVTLRMCNLCLDGVGGECHVPGCALYLNRAPDLKLRGLPLVVHVDPDSYGDGPKGDA